MSKEYQPKTGQRCSCKRGIQRDNCPACEGTGWLIDFKAIRERKSNPHLDEARKVLAEKGLEALYNPHAMIGKSCLCGSCFCCAAFEVWRLAR